MQKAMHMLEAILCRSWRKSRFANLRA